MGALAAHVGDAAHEILGQFALVAKVPLLDVWPLGHRLNVCGRLIIYREREEYPPTAPDAGISGASRASFNGWGNVWVGGGGEGGRGDVQGIGLCFVANPVLEEDSIS